jgi:hypothetical protein
MMKNFSFITMFLLIQSFAFSQEMDDFKYKNTNINYAYFDLEKIKPNIELCRCELSRYFSLSLQYQARVKTAPPVNLKMIARFVTKCNGSGFYDDFIGLTQEEVFKFGSVSINNSPFNGNENKKIKIKEIYKILSGQTKFLESPSPFIIAFD